MNAQECSWWKKCSLAIEKGKVNWADLGKSFIGSASVGQATKPLTGATEGLGVTMIRWEQLFLACKSCLAENAAASGLTSAGIMLFTAWPECVCYSSESGQCSLEKIIWCIKIN